MSTNPEMVVVLWHEPYRAAAVVKGPFSDEKSAFAVATKLVVEEQKFDKATLHVLGAACVEVSNEPQPELGDEEEEGDVSGSSDSSMRDDAIEDANGDPED